MAKPIRFTPKNSSSGWRINIPAKISETGKRQQVFYRTQKLALAAADTLKKKVELFGVQARGIAPSLAEQATAASALLAPYGVDLIEVARRFVESEKRNLASAAVEDAIAAFRATGESWSFSQSTAYRLRGEKLINHFQGRMLSTITGEELQWHLSETTSGAGSFNQGLRLIRAFWRWCAKPPRKWCDLEAVAHLEGKSGTSGEIGTLTPTQVSAVLSAAEKHFPEAVPGFAIALFTGMRQAEIERLKPSDVTVDGITVPAVSAKTKRRRFIQMPEPLAAWLKAYPITDSVTPRDWRRKQTAVRRLAGFKVWSELVPRLNIEPRLEATPSEDLPEWPDNALRHTAATIALALGKPLEQLIFEHGHTGGLEMLRRHYIGAMPKADALKIWNVRPASRQKLKRAYAVA